MSTSTDESVAAPCAYCGCENPERLPICSGCGTSLGDTPLPADSKSKGKSKTLAICLALIFGPLGLAYVKAWQTAFLMILIGAPFVLTHTGGMWVTVGSRVLCAVWAYCVVVEQDRSPNAKRDSSRLLDKAASLEGTNRAKAIAVYEEIIRLYPGTSASREAARNTQTLTRRP